MDHKYHDILHNRERSRSFMSDNYIERTNDRILFLYVLQNRHLSGSIEVDNRIDEESKIILSTFNKEMAAVYSSHMSQRIPTLILSKQSSIIEYSSLIHSLSKIMEIELNNSIVQYIRLLNGIEMPKYYKLFKPEFEAIVPTGKDGCNINFQYEGLLKPQTIGSIQCLVKHYKHQLSELFGRPFEDFIDLWEKIREKRNAASHTKIISEEEFIRFYNYFCEIVSNGWFTKLMDLKQQLRGC